MKIYIQVLLWSIITLISSCQRKQTTVSQKYSSHRAISHHQAAEEVLETSLKWVQAFNSKNFDSINKGYQENAILRQDNQTQIKGQKSISNYWKKFITSTGASLLTYKNIKVQVISDSLVYLSANWEMNIARGYIYRETWEKHKGKWLLAYDGFEVVEIFSSKKSILNTAIFKSHTNLLKAINASKKWVTNFNLGLYKETGNAYNRNAIMFSNPLGVEYGKDEIKAFWKKLIDNKVTNLIYDQPIFEEKNDKMLLQANWSMNKYQGIITLEKWSIDKDTWKLFYDEFHIDQ